MRQMVFALVALLGGSVGAFAWNGDVPQPPVPAAATCFLKGEQTSGLNKICYYDCLGSAAAITVQAFQLCPLSIQR